MAKTFSRGFTMIELLIVIAVIAILATIAYPVYIGIQERAKVTKDMNNLRQIGVATQLYLNDNDGALFTPGGIWMTQLHPKYLASWNIFLSPFDNPVPPRTASEDDANSAVSYGLNGNTKGGGSSIAGLSMDKIYSVSAFIIFAPAQNSGSSVAFDGTPSAAVTVYKDTSTPGGTAPAPPPPHGTYSNRTRINALFADLHVETLAWSRFINDSTTDTSDPDAKYRWDPYQPYP